MIDTNHYVYVLHFDTPLKGFQHYIGRSRVFDRRMQLHRSGHGSKWVRWFANNGRDFVVSYKEKMADSTAAWVRERQLKRRKNTRALCSVCTPSRR